MATENFKILVYSAEILQINCQTVAAAKTMACRPCIFALRSTQAYGAGLTGCEGNCLPAVYKKFAQNQQGEKEEEEEAEERREEKNMLRQNGLMEIVSEGVEVRASLARGDKILPVKTAQL